ncbi:hypothetical protein CISG_00306 [Coccidioides immitis RMSCC 3703]|uniref:Uncharacterized protein n=1 Tax=Coccidioides immitis RMSCC 3703 TaxID=454286 RepID=A0A0J8TEL7_COCIT|nr:hypothetical protein CISG_00306 [Coccidioides immitis RMSCC 3703]
MLHRLRFFALSYLRQNRKALTDSDVSVEFIPVFLGGINEINRHGRSQLKRSTPTPTLSCICQEAIPREI